MLRSHFSDTQLASHITGKVLISSLPTFFGVVRTHRVFEDNPSQFGFDGIVFFRSTK